MGDNDELHGFVSEYETESDDAPQNGGRNSRIKIIKCTGYIVLIALIVGIGYITYDKDNLIKYIERVYDDKSNNTVYGIILLGEYGCVPNYTNNSNTDMDMDILFNFSCVFGDTLINPMNLIHTINNTIKHDNSNDIDLFKYNSDNNIVFEFEMIYDKFKYNVLYGNVTNGDNLNIIGVNSITMTNIHNPSYKYILHDNIDYAYVTIDYMGHDIDRRRLTAKPFPVPNDENSISVKDFKEDETGLEIWKELVKDNTFNRIMHGHEQNPELKIPCREAINAFNSRYYNTDCSVYTVFPTKTATAAKHAVLGIANVVRRKKVTTDDKTTVTNDNIQEATESYKDEGKKVINKVAWLRERCQADSKAIEAGEHCWQQVGHEKMIENREKEYSKLLEADVTKVAEAMAKEDEAKAALENILQTMVEAGRRERENYQKMQVAKEEAVQASEQLQSDTKNQAIQYENGLKTDLKKVDDQVQQQQQAFEAAAEALKQDAQRQVTANEHGPQTYLQSGSDAAQQEQPKQQEIQAT